MSDPKIEDEEGFRAKKELCAVREIAKYVFKTLDDRKERVCYQIAMDIFTSLVTDAKYCQYTTGKERLDEIAKVFCGNTDISKTMMSELVLRYMNAAGVPVEELPSLNIPVMAGQKQDPDILKVKDGLFEVNIS